MCTGWYSVSKTTCEACSYCQIIYIWQNFAGHDEFAWIHYEFSLHASRSRAVVHLWTACKFSIFFSPYLTQEDMSRFGRNYLQVGFYTEIMFPQKQVRFMVSAAALVWFLPGWAALRLSSRCWMAAMHRRQLRRLWRCCYAHLQHRCCYRWREVPWLSLHQRYLLGYSENRIWRWTAVGCTAVFLFQIAFKKS